METIGYPTSASTPTPRSQSIPARTIPLDEPDLAGNEARYLQECITSRWISWQGPFVGRLETLLAERCQVRGAVALSNGTFALVLALQALGIGRDDEVIVPALSMSAPVFAVSAVGARPVFAENAPRRFTLDVADVARRVTPRTRAVIAVHLYGRVVDVEALRAAVGPRVAIVEDAAEALGASLRGRPAGSSGDVTAHSFHNKIVASGEGGAVSSGSEQVLERVRALRTPSPNNRNADPGLVLNHRMSNVAAAVGLAQLERLDDFLARRRAVARAYAEALRGVPGVSTVEDAPGESCAFWRVQVLLEDGCPVDVDTLAARLAERGVEARPVFSPMHQHPLYAAGAGKFPNAEWLCAHALDLPSGTRLSLDDVRRVAAHVAELVK